MLESIGQGIFIKAFVIFAINAAILIAIGYYSLKALSKITKGIEAAQEKELEIKRRTAEALEKIAEKDKNSRM